MMNEDGKQGVIDTDSNIVIQPKYKSVFIDREPIIDSTGYASGMNGILAILIDENGQTGVNLNSLEKSPLHRNMAIIKNHFYYHDSTHWGIYDSNFDLVVENMSGQPMVLSSNLEWTIIPFNSDYYSFYMPEKWKLEEKGQIEKFSNFEIFEQIIAYTLVVEYAGTNDEKYIKWVKRNPVKFRYTRRFGLFDLSNQKRINPNYHDLYPVLFNREIYFWCVKYKKHDNTEDPEAFIGHIDVRNSDLKKVKRLYFDQLPQEINNYFFFYESHKFDESKILYLLEFKDKMCAFNARGEIVIPKSDSIISLENGTYKVWEGEEVKVVNFNGEVVE